MGKRYGSREISDVVLKDITSGEPKLYLETLKVSSTDVKADQVSSRGGSGNPKRITWDSNKEVAYNMQDALISPESMAILAGTEVAIGAVLAHKKEYVTVGAFSTELTIGSASTKLGTVILTLNGVAHTVNVGAADAATAVATAIGALSVDGFAFVVDGAKVTIYCNSAFTYSYALGTAEGCTGTFDPATTAEVATLKVVLAETPKAGEDIFVFATVSGFDIGTALAVTTGYTVTGNLLTVVAGAVDGDGLIVDYYYDSDATAKSIIISSNQFPGYYRLEASTLWRDELTGIDVPALYTMPKIKLSSAFKIDNSADGEPAVFDFNCDVFPDPQNNMVIIDILE